MYDRIIKVYRKTDYLYFFAILLTIGLVIYGGFVVCASFRRGEEWLFTAVDCLLSVLVIWCCVGIVASRRLTFDLSTGEMTYRSLFCRKRHFHVSEVETEIDSEPNSRASSLYHEYVETLYISSDSVYVTILLGRPRRKVQDRYREHSDGGAVHADLLLRFLDDNGVLENLKLP